MPPIDLSHRSSNGETWHATFLPDKGMNLISFKKGDIEVIDQSTWALFEERFAGLGALIGPHFHRRKAEVLPKIQNEELFPHIARVKAKGVLDPFSHGIARYAPWKAEATSNHVKARISGKDTWNGVALSLLEGQNFQMQLDARLREEGLFLNLSVVSDTASLVGIHYYFRLFQGKGKVTSQVQNEVGIDGAFLPIPNEWSFDSNHRLIFNLDHEADYTFHPFPNKLKGDILLETGDYSLKTHYECDSAENSWQLYHPKGASYVCIEPISAHNPRNCNLTVSNLFIHLDIFRGSQD